MTFLHRVGTESYILVSTFAHLIWRLTERSFRSHLATRSSIVICPDHWGRHSTAPSLIVICFAVIQRETRCQSMVIRLSVNCHFGLPSSVISLSFNSHSLAPSFTSRHLAAPSLNSHSVVSQCHSSFLITTCHLPLKPKIPFSDSRLLRFTDSLPTVNCFLLSAFCSVSPLPLASAFASFKSKIRNP